MSSSDLEELDRPSENDDVNAGCSIISQNFSGSFMNDGSSPFSMFSENSQIWNVSFDGTQMQEYSSFYSQCNFPLDVTKDSLVRWESSRSRTTRRSARFMSGVKPIGGMRLRRVLKHPFRVSARDRTKCTFVNEAMVFSLAQSIDANTSRLPHWLSAARRAISCRKVNRFGGGIHKPMSLSLPPVTEEREDDDLSCTFTSSASQTFNRASAPVVCMADNISKLNLGVSEATYQNLSHAPPPTINHHALEDELCERLIDLPVVDRDTTNIRSLRESFETFSVDENLI